MITLKLLARRTSRLALAVGLMSGMAACGAPDGNDGTVDEQGGALANGRPGGGVGVVKLTITDATAATGAQCTGTVISGNRVITAGHCFDPWLTIKKGGGTTALLRGDLLAGAEYTKDGTNWICLNNPSLTSCPLSSFVSIHVNRLGTGVIPPDIAIVRFASPLQGIKSAEYRELDTGDLHVKQTVEQWGSGFTNPAGTAGGSASMAMMKAVVRLTSVSATEFDVAQTVAQSCFGDSGGPFFAGASDLVVGVTSRGTADTSTQCISSTAGVVATRVTPAVIDMINNNRQGADPLCHETIAGTGIQACF